MKGLIVLAKLLAAGTRGISFRERLRTGFPL